METQDRLLIHGGTPLSGTVRISGAKNETTKLMVASALLDSEVVLENVPHIGDVDITSELLQNLGATVHYSPDKATMRVDARSLKKHEAIYVSNRGNRLSILLAGPLLYRFGQAVVQKPGGCKIGDRPLDLHIHYLRALGITIEEEGNVIKLRGTLRGNTIAFPYKSVGATEGALLAAVYASGETVIKNAANEPEITEQIKFLQRAGSLIEYDANQDIHVHGVSRPLHLDHPITIIGDRVEAISYACAAVASNGSIRLEGIQQHQIITPLTALRQIGARIAFDGKAITISRDHTLKPLNVETDPYPAFATDYQQMFAVVLSLASGTSYIHETVHDNRFAYLGQLNKLGGHFEVSETCKPFANCRFSSLHNHTAKIAGPMQFHGGMAEITDLRAAFALVMAGLLSSQPTHLSEANHLLRGYDHPIEKLTRLGARIELG